MQRPMDEGGERLLLWKTALEHFNRAFDTWVRCIDQLEVYGWTLGIKDDKQFSCDMSQSVIKGGAQERLEVSCKCETDGQCALRVKASSMPNKEVYAFQHALVDVISTRLEGLSTSGLRDSVKVVIDETNKMPVINTGKGSFKSWWLYNQEKSFLEFNATFVACCRMCGKHKVCHHDIVKK